MTGKFQRLGVRLGVTLSLERAIIAPSLKTAIRTTSSVGKYLLARSKNAMLLHRLRGMPHLLHQCILLAMMKSLAGNLIACRRFASLEI